MPTILPDTSTSGPPELPGINRGVGLQKILIGARALKTSAVFGTDDAKRDAAVEAKRIANGPHQRSHFERVAVAPLGGDQSARAILSTARSVVSSSPTTVAGRRSLPLRLTHDLAGVFDHVIVRENIARFVDDDARSLADGLLAFLAFRSKSPRDPSSCTVSICTTLGPMALATTANCREISVRAGVGNCSRADSTWARSRPTSSRRTAARQTTAATRRRSDTTAT